MKHNNNINQALATAYPVNQNHLAATDPAFKGPSNNWESLENVYQIHVKMFQQYYQLNQYLLIPQVQDNLQNLQVTTNLAKGMAADINMLWAKTQKIYKKHAGKVGFSKDVDDNFAIIMIHQEYAGLNDQHQLLVLPMMSQVNEQIVYAINKIQAQAAAQQAPVPA
jgi:hypothetical protein